MAEPRDDDPIPPPGELDDFFRVVDRLPFLGSLKKDLSGLRALLYDRRAPRILALGAPGSGRTSLANALLRLPALPLGEHPAVSADAWVRIDAAGRHLDWLEVSSEPLDEARIAALHHAFDESPPDVVLLVASAEYAVDEAAALERALPRVLDLLDDAPGTRPAVLAVLTRVDALGPPETSDAAGEARLSSAHAAQLADLATKVAATLAGRLTKRRPLAVLAGGHPGGPALRWNVARVADAIFEALPATTHVEAARALAVSPSVRRDLARTVVNHCSAAAVTVGLAPVPFSDAILLLPLQGVMVTGIAYLAGQPWDRRAALEWLGSVGVLGGAAFGLRWAAQQALKFVPGAGTLVAGSVAGAGTLAIGRSAIAYFVDGPGARLPHFLLPADTTSAEGV